MTTREMMQRRAEETAVAVGFSRSPAKQVTFIFEYDAATNEHHELGVFTWPRGIVTVDSRTLAATTERRP
jgi:hypothetical protein